MSSAKGATPRYSLGEEVAHSITHGLGFGAAVVGLVLLVLAASDRDGTIPTVAAAVYGASLVLLYAASTLYHAVPYPGAKQVLRLIDHSFIYLLIAGSYTPFTLLTLRGPWGWALLSLVWGLALGGIIFELFWAKRFRRASLAFYLALGWLSLVAIRPLVAHLATDALVLLVVGGALYSGGAAFYAWKRLPYHHAIWHVFVVAGSVCHWFAIRSEVLAA